MQTIYLSEKTEKSTRGSDFIKVECNSVTITSKHKFITDFVVRENQKIYSAKQHTLIDDELQVEITNSIAMDERARTKKNGRYSDAPKCEVCGKGIFDYYSHPDCNLNGHGVVLCKDHADMSMDDILKAVKD